MINLEPLPELVSVSVLGKDDWFSSVIFEYLWLHLQVDGLCALLAIMVDILHLVETVC